MSTAEQRNVEVFGAENNVNRKREDYAVQLRKVKRYAINCNFVRDEHFKMKRLNVTGEVFSTPKDGMQSL